MNNAKKESVMYEINNVRPRTWKSCNECGEEFKNEDMWEIKWKLKPKVDENHGCNKVKFHLCMECFPNIDMVRKFCQAFMYDYFKIVCCE